MTSPIRFFQKRSDFNELGTSQHIVEDMLDNSFKELRIATWLKNRMGEVINRPLLRARKLHRNSKKVDNFMLVFIVFMILQSYRRSNFSGVFEGVY